MKRREFVQNGLFGGVGLLTSQVTGAAVTRDYPFTLGVASGDPTPESVVIWTRLAPDPTNGGGMPPLPVLVLWRIADDPRITRIVQYGTTIAWPGVAHAVHVDVTGLSPDRWYYYQFAAGSAESPVGRTRTLPARGAHVDRFRFAFVSCQDWQHGFYSAYRNLAREDIDLVVHLGDYIYEGGPQPGPRQHIGAEVQSLADYRNRYALYKTDPHLQAAHAAFPFFVVPDDHEVENNYAGAHPQDRTDPAQFLIRRANAYRAYYEHMPLRVQAFPIGPWMRLYRRMTVGDLLQVNALDTRQFRSDQPCGDNLQFPCAAQFASSKTMTGAAQEQWLLEQLDGSIARWNVIAQQTMFAQFDFLAGGGQLFNMDQWDGYVAARRRITDFLQLRRPSNPIVLTGDIHSSWVHDLKADFNNPGSAVVGTEFVGTSITSEFPAIAVPFVAAAMADNPHTTFFDGLFRGYVRCTVEPGAWASEFRVVPTILTDAADAFTLASFIVVDGQPGAFRLT
jgi:alkaline phosphatase D